MNKNTGNKSIIVGVDGSPGSIDALRKAAELADLLGTPLQAVTAWQFPLVYDASYVAEGWSPDEDAKDTLSHAIATAFPNGAPEGLTRSITAGPAARTLVALSGDASMLVLGSRGRGGFVGLLLGSVSAACAQHAHCPVLIMHGANQRKNSANENGATAERHTA